MTASSTWRSGQRRSARRRRSQAPADPVASRQPAPLLPPRAEGAGPEPNDVLPRLAKLAGAVLGPTTVLTGLLFYFGRMHVTGYFRYLRVNFTVLDLTANDY